MNKTELVKNCKRYLDIDVNRIVALKKGTANILYYPYKTGANANTYEVGDIFGLKEPCRKVATWGTSKGTFNKYEYEADNLNSGKDYPHTKVPEDSVRMFAEVTEVETVKMADLTGKDFQAAGFTTNDFIAWWDSFTARDKKYNYSENPKVAKIYVKIHEV